MADWEAVGIVLASAPFGEADAIVTLLTAEHGAHRGLVRGGRSRGAGRATWEIGNVVRARWVGRLADQLGAFNAEILQSPASVLLDSPIRLSTLAAACSVAQGALPERSGCPRTFECLVYLLAGLVGGQSEVPALVRWELVLLDELGYGLDLSRCARTGRSDTLAFVSPRTGCAVSLNAAGEWKSRLLPLPRYVIDDAADVSAGPDDWRDGLTLSGHFLARDAFGIRHLPLPASRLRLLDMVSQLSQVGRTNDEQTH